MRDRPEKEREMLKKKEMNGTYVRGEETFISSTTRAQLRRSRLLHCFSADFTVRQSENSLVS